MDALRQDAINQIVEILDLAPEQARSCLQKLMEEGIIVPFISEDGADVLGFDWTRVFGHEA